MNVDIRIIEIGGTFFLLAIFIALFAFVKDIAGAWSNIGYVLLLLAFTAAMSFFGMKLVPYLNQ